MRGAASWPRTCQDLARARFIRICILLCKPLIPRGYHPSNLLCSGLRIHQRRSSSPCDWPPPLQCLRIGSRDGSGSDGCLCSLLFSRDGGLASGETPPSAALGSVCLCTCQRGSGQATISL